MPPKKNKSNKKAKTQKLIPPTKPFHSLIDILAPGKKGKKADQWLIDYEDIVKEIRTVESLIHKANNADKKPESREKALEYYYLANTQKSLYGLEQQPELMLDAKAKMLTLLQESPESRSFIAEVTSIEDDYLVNTPKSLDKLAPRPELIKDAIANMWTFLQKSSDNHSIIAEIASMYNEIGNEAAAFTCLFYEAKNHSPDVLRNLASFYEQGRPWLTPDITISNGFKNLATKIASDENFQSNILNTAIQNKGFIESLLFFYDLKDEKKEIVHKIEKQQPQIYEEKTTLSQLSIADPQLSEKEFSKIQSSVQMVEDNIKTKQNNSGQHEIIKQSWILYHRSKHDKSIQLKTPFTILAQLYLDLENNAPAAFACLFHSARRDSCPQAMKLLAKIYHHGSSWLPANHDIALQLVQLSVQKNDQDEESLLLLGALLAAKKNLKDAIIYLEKALIIKRNKAQRDTDYLNCLFDLASCYFQEDKFEQFEQYSKEFLERTEHTPSFNKDRAKLIGFLGIQKYRDAEERYSEGDPQQAIAFRQAVKYFKQAQSLNYAQDIAIALGLIYIALNKKSTGLDYLKQAAKKNHSLAYKQLAKVYLMDVTEEKNLEKGIKYVEKYCELASQNVNHKVKLYLQTIKAIQIKIHMSDLEQEKGKLLISQYNYLKKLINLFGKNENNHDFVKHTGNAAIVYALYGNGLSLFKTNAAMAELALLYYYKAIIHDFYDAWPYYSIGLYFFDNAATYQGPDNKIDMLSNYQKALYYFQQARDKGLEENKIIPMLEFALNEIEKIKTQDSNIIIVEEKNSENDATSSDEIETEDLNTNITCSSSEDTSEDEFESNSEGESKNNQESNKTNNSTPQSSDLNLVVQCNKETLNKKHKPKTIRGFVDFFKPKIAKIPRGIVNTNPKGWFDSDIIKNENFYSMSGKVHGREVRVFLDKQLLYPQLENFGLSKIIDTLEKKTQEGNCFTKTDFKPLKSKTFKFFSNINAPEQPQNNISINKKGQSEDIRRVKVKNNYEMSFAEEWRILTAEIPLKQGGSFFFPNSVTKAFHENNVTQTRAGLLPNIDAHWPTQGMSK